MLTMKLKVKTKSKLTRADQYNRLVQFIKENPDLALYTQIKTAQQKMASNTLWQNLTVQLNANGPPLRTVEGWKKVWKDYKYHVKRKCYITQKNYENRSTDKPALLKRINFTENERTIAKLLNLNIKLPLSCRFKIVNITTPITHSTTADQFETPTIKTELTDMFFKISEVTGGSDNIDTTTLPANNDKYEPIVTNGEPLNKSPEQEEGNSLINEKLEIEKQIRKLKVEKLNNLKHTSELNRRHFELKQKMYELKKRKFEIKCKQLKDELKYKTEKLEIKRREVELKEASNLRKEIKFQGTV